MFIEVEEAKAGKRYVCTLLGKKALKAKVRISLCICCYASGSIHILILVVRCSAQPIQFKHVGKPDQNWIWYTHQENSWMYAGWCQHWFDAVFVSVMAKLYSFGTIVLVTA